MSAPSSPSSLRHIAVIMDGNGRWAKNNNKPRIEGHRQGVQAVRETIAGALEAGVEFLTLYAFSVENWKRPKAEINGLMELLAHALENQIKELQKNEIRLNAVGRLDDLPSSVRKRLQSCIDATAENKRLNLTLALSYSSRVEIVEAVRNIASKIKENLIQPDDIDESLISENLYTHNMPDPDLLIRTSGEMRLSNFLLWQLSYTEIHVTPVLWPDFRKENFLQAVEDFNGRQRRYGGL